MEKIKRTRRDFLKESLLFTTAAVVGGPVSRAVAGELLTSCSKIKFGLVTYKWGKDWDLPTLIANCEKAKVLGVELRTHHAHGVEAELSSSRRREVKMRFADSPVTLLGPGTNFSFHYPDPKKLRDNIEDAKKYIKLSHDIGGTGVKVKPNDLPEGVPQEKTIEQIGKSLNELACFGADYGQQIRLEVHGDCSPPPVIKAIMDVADNPNVGVCWNCNSEDLEGDGLKYNFNLIKDRFGDTAHIRCLDNDNYPYQQLLNLFVDMDYDGWMLLEARSRPKDKVKALEQQRLLCESMLKKARSRKTAAKPEHQKTGVNIIREDEHLTVEINGELFTRYYYSDPLFPYFYPVIGPTGDCIIRHWPMKEGVPHESTDHRHHRSLWFTHGAVNGEDFWTLHNKKDGKIAHDGFSQITSGKDVGIIKTRNKWIGSNGKIYCTDTRTQRFYNTEDTRVMDFEVTINASHGKVVLGDTKEGSMAIRLTPTMRVEGEVGEGHIINSEGDEDRKTWGKRAAWCDYYGPVNGKTVGVAIFDHPKNPKHPTWWHVRKYGLFAANPFGVHNFEKKPKGTGDIIVEDGNSITFRYRFYFHKGDAKQAAVQQHYDKYAQSVSP